MILRVLRGRSTGVLVLALAALLGVAAPPARGLSEAREKSADGVAPADATAQRVAAPEAGVPAPRYVASRTITLDYRVPPGTQVDSVALWSALDGGWCWQPLCVDQEPRGAVTFTVSCDARYDLYLVLHNSAGDSGPPPQPGDTPHAVVVVDTSPPLLQVHRVKERREAAEGAEARPALALQLTLIDDCTELVDTPALRVYFCAPEGRGSAPSPGSAPSSAHDARSAPRWIDGGPARLEGDVAWWTVPAEAPDVVDLRIVATDRAGNQSSDELATVTLR